MTTFAKNTVKAIQYALQSAKDHTWSGITLEGNIVTTFQCVEAQVESGNLLLYMVATSTILHGEIRYKIQTVYCEGPVFLQLEKLRKIQTRRIKKSWLKLAK